MDKRKQKYFDYIIKDLMSNTSLKGDMDSGFNVILPFDTLYPPPVLSTSSYLSTWKTWSNKNGLGILATEYLEDKYGFNRSDHYDLLEPFFSKLKEKAINMSS
jgi:hypothetical protein|tara:strand:+ start:292 stop:600 length:309 start_codon:yes stop_codon:yes gene_type:complete